MAAFLFLRSFLEQIFHENIFFIDIYFEMKLHLYYYIKFITANFVNQWQVPKWRFPWNY